MQIKLTNIVKNYATVTAGNKASFAVGDGEIVALLGPNGAGKSSLVRMLVGFTFPDSGEIEISDGEQVTNTIPKHQLGYLPEDRGLFLDRSLYENLMYLAKLRGLSSQVADEKIDYWLHRFDLTDRAKEPLKSLSKGNQQKIQLISSVLHEPKIAILDEPFSGLDPINQEIVVSIIKEFQEKGMTVLLSAHQMNLVERLADRVVLMNLGEIIAQGSLAEIRQQLTEGEKLIVRFNGAIDEAKLAALSTVAGYEQTSNYEYYFTTTAGHSLNQVINEIKDLAEILDIRSEHLGLHDLYLEAIKKANDNQQEQTA